MNVNEETSGRNSVECPRCGFTMTPIQVCHLRCQNCGNELTCSDKGSFW